MLPEDVLNNAMSNNAPEFGVYVSFMQVSAPVFVHFAGLSGRGLFQPGVGHGCSADGTHTKPERNYDLGMDALVIARTQKLNSIRSWAWMLGRPYAWDTNGIMIWAWMLC